MDSHYVRNRKIIDSRETVDDLYDLHRIGVKRMIALTRMNGAHFYLNATMVESIETTPDTVLTLVSGKKILVRETALEIIAMINAYYCQIGIIGLQGAIEGNYDKDEIK